MLGQVVRIAIILAGAAVTILGADQAWKFAQNRLSDGAPQVGTVDSTPTDSASQALLDSSPSETVTPNTPSRDNSTPAQNFGPPVVLNPSASAPNETVSNADGVGGAGTDSGNVTPTVPDTTLNNSVANNSVANNSVANTPAVNNAASGTGAGAATTTTENQQPIQALW